MTNYKLTEETKEYKGITLHRIELTEDCKWGKKGDKGGWVESMDNLSGGAWVSGNAEVWGNACVFGDAWVYGSARVYGNAEVFGGVNISDKTVLISGEWDSIPMYLQIREDISMNMSGPGILRIGDEHKLISEWLEDKGYKYRRYVWIFADEYGL